MKKKIILVILFLATGAFAGYMIYKLYAPAIIANELLKTTEPVFLPPKIKEKINKVKIQTNQLSENIIKDIHSSNISLDQILKELDKVTEENAYAFLDEINSLGEIKSADQIFDLGKKHFPVDFDVEPLREPFRKKAELHLLQKGIQKANQYRDNEVIDFESAKAIVKRILIEKEKEFNHQLNIINENR